MSQQLVVGKYKFYPYEPVKERTISLDELAELGEKLGAKRAGSKTPSPSRKPRRKE